MAATFLGPLTKETSKCGITVNHWLCLSYFGDDMPKTLEEASKKVIPRKATDPTPEWAIVWRKGAMTEDELRKHPPEPPLPTCIADLDKCPEDFSTNDWSAAVSEASTSPSKKSAKATS